MTEETDYSKFYNKGNDCDCCKNQYLERGDVECCRKADNGEECEFIEIDEDGNEI